MPPRRVPGLLATAACALLAACGAISSAAGPGSGGGERPNIVVIMADDLGYSDLGAYGGEIRTPNLDRLARNGLRFSQFYNTSRCHTTRASLMTGLYSHRVGVGGRADPTLPAYRGYLSRDGVTMAEVLRSAGYRTGLVGKWHLGRVLNRQDPAEQQAWLTHRADFGDFGPRDQYPTARGFDDYFGNLGGVVDFYDPFTLVHGAEPVKAVPSGYYHTDAISDTAVAWVDRYSRGGQPFFLYVAHTAPHWPLHALPEDIARYRAVYRAGWDAIRERRYRRLVEEGIIDPATAPLPPRVQPERDWATNPDSLWDVEAMAVHAAMVDRMDQGIGRLLRKLEETGELDNTLILFLADNGASYETPETYGPSSDRPGGTRDGRTVIFPAKKEALPGPQTVHAGIGHLWANAATTPFRYWKAFSHEGGIATPFIAHWPAGLRARGVTHQPGHVIDVMATALEVTGADYPDTFGGNRILPLDGKSLLPIFKGQRRPGHETLFWEHQGTQAVRRGDWKLVSPGIDKPWELYDLSTDRTELRDLAARYPDRARELEAAWNRWARETGALPRPASTPR